MIERRKENGKGRSDEGEKRRGSENVSGKESENDKGSGKGNGTAR